MHPTRVGARRARSTLRTFAALFEPGPRVAVDAALRGYARDLGQVRDLQVLRGVLAEHTAGHPGLQAWLDARLSVELAAAWARLERTLHAPGHHQLENALEALILASPRNGVDLDRCVRRAKRRAVRRLRGAGEDVERLHEARRAAKRARYAGEVVGDEKLVLRFQRLQDLLGTHHDLSVAAAYLTAAHAPGPPAELLPAVTATVAELRTAAEEARRHAIG